MFRKKARGLFDLLMASLAVATLCSSTPLGELAVRGLRRAAGIKGRPTTALISYFSAGELEPGAVGPLPAGPLATAALAYGNRPTLLKAFALASSHERKAPQQLAMDLSREGRGLLLARGAPARDFDTVEGRLRAVSRAVPGLRAELGSPDAALAALVVGIEPMRYAVERARAEGAEPSLERLLPHLPPPARARARAVVGQALTLLTAFELRWPLPRATRVTSRFGTRVHPITGVTQRHTGVDLSVPIGTPVTAAAAGIVQRVGEDGINGRFLIIDHGRGVKSAYCHADELLVGRGERVEAGEPVIRSGNTGRSTGPHLHYQVELGGTPVDPLALLADENAGASERS